MNDVWEDGRENVFAIYTRAGWDDSVSLSVSDPIDEKKEMEENV